jgi:FdhD protein
VLLTSRVSIELIQKAARLGAPVVAAVSAPTSAGVRLADACGITLVAVARGQDFEVFTHHQRIIGRAAHHVA